MDLEPCPNRGNPCFCTGVCLRPVGEGPPMRGWGIGFEKAESDDDADYRGDE